MIWLLKAFCFVLFSKHLQLFLFPGESSRNEAILYHQKHMVMTLLASFLYSAHLPERLAPGRFDYIGESGGAGVGVTLNQGGEILDNAYIATRHRTWRGVTLEGVTQA